MTVKELRWLFSAVLAVFFFWAFFGNPLTIGLFVEWSEGAYSFAGGTHPVALVFAIVVAALYLLLMFAPPANCGEPLPGLLRRFVSFWLDFILAMSMTSPVVGLLPAFAEWKRTGSFQWNLQRSFEVAGDGWLGALGSLLSFIALAFYFTVPLLRGRPSPGACIAGYQVVADEGVTLTLRKGLGRTLLGFIAVCGAYVAPFIARDRKKGKFWLDRVFGTHALRLR